MVKNCSCVWNFCIAWMPRQWGTSEDFRCWCELTVALLKSLELCHRVKRGWRLVSVVTGRKWQLRVKSTKKSVSWMQAFVHVGCSRADRGDAIPWHSSASLSSKKSHPVYLMQTTIVHSSSTCTGLCSFFISCLSWKSWQTPVSSSDLCCKQVFEKLRGIFGVSWTPFCHLFSHDE